MKKVLSLILMMILLTITGCTTQTNSITQTSSTAKKLPTINNLQTLKKLITNNEKEFGFRLGGAALESTQEDSASQSKFSGSDQSPDFSDTNVQVQGIDEGDIVKTDGNYLYQISNNNIIITKLYPIQEAKVISTTKLDKNLQPIEIYLHNDKLVVLSYKYDTEGHEGEIGIPRRTFFYHNNTIVQIYNNDNGKLTKERELETEGNIVATRKKDSIIYLVTSKYVGFLEDSVESPAPRYKDSAKDEEFYQKPLTDIQYFPNGELSSFVNIVALDIERPAQQAIVETYLGSAENIYMSHENLYIALTTMTETHVNKFSINGIKVQYQSEGRVPGRVLNQFSMDEHQGYFRIATTSHDREEMTNNLYILDKNLKTAGKLENLAPTERIYSARFMGDKGYLITFELIDPLFVLDLSNPRDPKVLGELKIPGFSNYLHPIDENHLLGIGRDTTITSQWGREVAIELGVRLTIFDVTDVNNPKEKFVETIGGRGTHSEALYNHKAIHYHNNKLAFPISVTDPSNTSFDQMSTPKFIGAYIYQLDTEKGFDLEATITHMTPKQTEDYYNFYHPNNFQKEIRRIITIENHTYTISDATIQIHNPNYQQIKEIPLN